MKLFISSPIPPDVPTTEEWKKVEIFESNELLIDLNSVSEKITCKPYYFHKKIKGSIERCYARERLAIKLGDICLRLPEKYGLVIYDAWRPLEVQKKLYQFYSGDKKGYVAQPSHNPKAPPPHLSGGSVDINLTFEGNELDMGSAFDYFGNESETRYFENKELNEQEKKYRNNRRMLYHLMTNAGFSNYEREWWHFDFGNQAWGQKRSTQAIYGLVSF